MNTITEVQFKDGELLEFANASVKYHADFKMLEIIDVETKFVKSNINYEEIKYIMYYAHS